MFKKIVYLVVLIILSMCVVERVRVAILDKCFFPSMYLRAQKTDNYKTYLKCAQIKILARDYERAETILLTVLRNATTQEYKAEKQKAFFYLGNSYFETGDYDDALKAYAVVLKNEPGNRKALKNFARIKMAKGEYVSLYPFVTAYIKAKPKDSFGYTENCALLTRIGKYSQARQFCQKAIEIRRGSARAHYDYAVLYDKMGFKDLARDEMKQAKAQQAKIKSREELEAMLEIDKKTEP